MFKQKKAFPIHEHRVHTLMCWTFHHPKAQLCSFNRRGNQWPVSLKCSGTCIYLTVKPIVKVNQPLKKNKKGPGTWYTNSTRENRKTLLLSQMTKLCVAKFQSWVPSLGTLLTVFFPHLSLVALVWKFHLMLGQVKHKESSPNKAMTSTMKTFYRSWQKPHITPGTGMWSTLRCSITQEVFLPTQRVVLPSSKSEQSPSHSKVHGNNQPEGDGMSPFC